MRFILMFLIFTINISAFAVEQSTNFEPAEQTKSKNLFCPDAELLTKSGDFWKVNDVWESDSPSFGTKIESFIGAQWFGVNVGKIVCLYKEDSKIAFPVALITTHPVLIFEPKDSKWTTTKDNYKQCVSNTVYDCAFLQKVQKTNITNIYEEIKYQPKGQN